MKVWAGFLTPCMPRAVNVYAYYLLILEWRTGIKCTNRANLKKNTYIYLNPSF